MKFDPTKPFSPVVGISTTFPGAKYQQGPFIYNAHRVCINAKQLEKEIASTVVSDEVAAANELLILRTAQADEALKKFKLAEKKLASIKPENKAGKARAETALAKARNAYDIAQDELEEAVAAKKK
jgi:hypothetical protein